MIYKPVKRRAIHNDLIVIVGNKSEHFFPNGAVCQVVSLYSTGSPPHFAARRVSDTTEEYQILTNSDDYRVLKPIKEKKRKRKKKADTE